MSHRLIIWFAEIAIELLLKRIRKIPSAELNQRHSNLINAGIRLFDAIDEAVSDVIGVEPESRQT